MGRRCSLERNYPPRDRDEAAVALEGASGGRRGGERERGRERGKGDGVVFTRHGCSRGGVPCRAVVAPSSLLVPRYPVLRRSSIVGQIERARPQQSERASLRIRYELFSSSSSFFFPSSLPIASRDTCRRRRRYLVRVETIEQQRRVRSELSSDCHEEEVGVGSVWRD